MTGQQLESPRSSDELYLATADDVESFRPVFTGDVYTDVHIEWAGISSARTILIVQHPCALRKDGINLNDRILVVEVDGYNEVGLKEWKSHYKVMPLPGLPIDVAHPAAKFKEVYLVSDEQLRAGTRIACMSQRGVNLLLQRWVNHNSRVVIPTITYNSYISAEFEEADLAEEWLRVRAEAVGPTEANQEFTRWLREDVASGRMRQSLLKEPQDRSTIRSEMNMHLRELSSKSE